MKCCFTSTETVGLLGTGAQDVHLGFHTAPELCPHLSAHPLFALPPAHQLLICLSHISSAHIPLLTAPLPPLLSSAHTPLALSPAHYLFTCHISVLLTHLLLCHLLTTCSPVTYQCCSHTSCSFTRSPPFHLSVTYQFSSHTSSHASSFSSSSV